jgi:hypothetical protein
MQIVGWLRRCFSIRYQALQLYRHGRKRAGNKDHERAIVDFTKAIQLVAVPTDVQALALYHRATAYLALGDKEQARKDLGSVLVMDGVLAVVNVKTMARQMLEKIKS